ncbi:zinc finger SWIM domain-containing protein 7 isoform X3 [Nematostella vectensis]|nr:zinc finger SWIM domain-containing protein 7 isoform X3 [Nematostella vectensis]
MSALYFVFHEPVLHGLDLVDRRSITKLVSPSGRTIYQVIMRCLTVVSILKVIGSAGQMYTCLLSSDYCTCPSYTYTVLVKMDSILCKHLLAAHLAEALGNIKEKRVLDHEVMTFTTQDF